MITDIAISNDKSNLFNISVVAQKCSLRTVANVSQNLRENYNNGVLYLVNLLEIGLQCRCFPVNFEKLFKAIIPFPYF